MEEPTRRAFDAELWLRSLAGDILAHEGCESCRINAAEALERLGSIEETLARLGIEDPREPHSGAPEERQARATAGRAPRVRLEFEADIVVHQPTDELGSRISSAVRAAVDRAIGELPGVVLGNFTMAISTDHQAAVEYEDVPSPDGVAPAAVAELALAIAGEGGVEQRPDLRQLRPRELAGRAPDDAHAHPRSLPPATGPPSHTGRMIPPAPEPYETGHLDVGDGHVLRYEEMGNPHGTPLVYLHGGPGQGITPGSRRNYDLDRHRAVLFDQRASGQSTPHASQEGVHWDSIDMDHHVADIERLRQHLGIDRWIVFGVSWGSVLGATYAERHPERARAVVLAAVSTGTAADIDWLTVAMARYFPAEWRAFRDHVPAELRHLRLVDAYHRLLMDPDPAVREAAALAWCTWEDAHMATTPKARRASASEGLRHAEPAFRLGFARQVTHCWRHNSWLTPDEIATNAGRLAGIPGCLIHGRFDLSSPLDAPWRIHQAWPGSELIIVDDEGHGGETMAQHWCRMLAEYA